MSSTNQVGAYYGSLQRAWGKQHWWPAHTRFEVIVGAYLTQNTSWKNVELALTRLRKAKALSLRGIRELEVSHLERLIQPAGYFRQKARSLKTFVKFVDAQYGGSLERMFAVPTEKLRDELLGLKGVGPETADSILLYAGQHAVFVVDAYTRRIFERHGLIESKVKYDEIRSLVERSLAEMVSQGVPQSDRAIRLPMAATTAHSPSRMSRAKRTELVQVYNDMHGLIVATGKHFCAKQKPKCDECPLRDFLPAMT